MSVKRRWMKRMIETAKAETGPMPWRHARAARKASSERGTAQTGAIRTTLDLKGR